MKKEIFRSILAYKVTHNSLVLYVLNGIALIVVSVYGFSEFSGFVCVVLMMVFFANVYAIQSFFGSRIRKIIKTRTVSLLIVGLLLILMAIDLYLTLVDCSLPFDFKTVAALHQDGKKYPYISKESKIFGYLVMDSCSNRDDHNDRFIHIGIYMDGKKVLEQVLGTDFNDIRVESKTNKFIIFVKESLSHEDSNDVRDLPQYIEVRKISKTNFEEMK